MFEFIKNWWNSGMITPSEIKSTENISFDDLLNIVDDRNIELGIPPEPEPIHIFNEHEKIVDFFISELKKAIIYNIENNYNYNKISNVLYYHEGPTDDLFKIDCSKFGDEKIHQFMLKIIDGVKNKIPENRGIEFGYSLNIELEDFNSCGEPVFIYSVRLNANLNKQNFVGECGSPEVGNVVNTHSDKTIVIGDKTFREFLKEIRFL